MKTFPAKIQSLYDILNYVHQEIDQFGFICDTRKIELSVEEIVVNIISYGYKHVSSKNATITISCDLLAQKNGIAIYIQDHGIPYNPLESKNAKRSALASVEEPIGGLGIFLTLHLMDKVEYARESDSNILTLIKFAEGLEKKAE